MKENAILTKSYAFSVRIAKLYTYLKNEKSEYVMSKQVYRSGTSIGANVAEAQRAVSRADFAAKLGIALKEANETQYWLKVLYESGHLTEREFESIHTDLVEVLSLLTAICKSLTR